MNLEKVIFGFFIVSAMALGAIADNPSICKNALRFIVRHNGIEPIVAGWKPAVLPLHQERIPPVRHQEWATQAKVEGLSLSSVVPG